MVGRWEDFMDAPYEHQWAAAKKMLAEEPELCDGEMVFEVANDLFGQSVAAGEIDRYKELLDQLEQAAPEAYTEELHYILDWRIQIALIEGDEASVERYFYQFSPLAGDQLDLYYRVISALTYHGKLAVLHEGMRQARPYVAEGGNLAEWAYSEFIEKLADLEILYLADQNPNLTPDDSTLQQHFVEYEMMIVPERFANNLDYRTGRKTPAWTAADFALTKGEEQQESTKRNYTDLLAAFTYYAHHVAGIALTKAEMVSRQLSRYFMRRHDGELDEIENDYGQRPQRRRKRKPKHAAPQYPLCPDARTLDRYMAQLMGFMSFRYYEATALFELIPAWLRFLTQYNLLEVETEQQTVKALSYLKDALIQIADKQLSDPAVKENLMDWPYDWPKEE